MNRSLLLIVCDFLLLSLLALANFEKSGQPVTSERESAELEEIEASIEDNAMMDLLASALAAEQSSQSEIQRELELARETLNTMESDQAELNRSLEEKEKEITERERLLQEARLEAEQILQEKQAAEKQVAATEAEKERLAREREELGKQAEELSSTVRDLSQTADKTDEELRRKSEELARLESQLDDRERKLAAAETERQQAEAERSRLEGEVRISERENQILTSTLESAKETITLEREEKQQLRQQTEVLSEGVTRLAEASSEITNEVKSLRPMTANEIFRSVDENRVSIEFAGSRSSLFGDNPIDEKVDTVITQVNGRMILWIHISQTPFADPDRRRFIKGLEVFLESNGIRFKVPQLGILRQDPSLLFLPLSDEIVDRLGTKVFPTTATPFRFEDLVVIDLPESKFGETGFRIQSGQSNQIEVDNRVFSALFGEFSPSAGNLAFTKTGDFMGIVTRGGSAWMANAVDASGKISFGDQFTRSQLDSLP